MLTYVLQYEADLFTNVNAIGSRVDYGCGGENGAGET